MSKEQEKDEWDLASDEQIVILQKCQQDKALTGCEDCEQIIECEVRKNYVKAVYESMNKGSGGGFEF